MYQVNAVALTGNSQTLTSNSGLYVGFSIAETSGSAAAKLRIWDNASAASGKILEVISLRPGESTGDMFATPIRFENGIYVEKVSGAFEGSVRFT